MGNQEGLDHQYKNGDTALTIVQLDRVDIIDLLESFNEKRQLINVIIPEAESPNMTPGFNF